jgi:hypothetical protein
MNPKLAAAYSIKRRSQKMASGGMAHCAHGGPAYCNMGCYADGGMVEDAPEMSAKSLSYERGIDEPMNEAANKPRDPMIDSMDSEEALDEGDMSMDEPMKMARGGIFNPKKMARMAMGGMVKSEAALKEADDFEMAKEQNSGGPSDKEDIDVKWTTPHDDHLSSEGDYPLVEEEGYEEGHQAKMRRKGGLIDRVMSKMGR